MTLTEEEVDSDNNLETKTKPFEVEITTAGAGQLTIAAGEGKAPRIDQFEISLTKETSAATVNKDALKQAIEDATAKLKDTQYTQESRDALKAAIAEAQNVYEDPDATQEQVDAQTNLQNNFQLVKAPVTYTVTADAGANGSITLTGEARTEALRKDRTQHTSNSRQRLRDRHSYSERRGSSRSERSGDLQRNSRRCKCKCNDRSDI